MAVVIYETRITHRYLMRKTKEQLALLVEHLQARLGLTVTPWKSLIAQQKYYLAKDVLELSSHLPEETI